MSFWEIIPGDIMIGEFHGKAVWMFLSRRVELINEGIDSPFSLSRSRCVIANPDICRGENPEKSSRTLLFSHDDKPSPGQET